MTRFGTPNGPIKVGAKVALRYPPEDIWITGYAGANHWAGMWWEALSPWERWVVDQYMHYLHVTASKQCLEWDDLEGLAPILDEVMERVERCVPGFWDIPVSD